KRIVGFFDFFEAGGIAESRLILISLITSRISTTPSVESASNLGDIFIAQSTFCTVNHVSEIAGINEQNLVSTVNRTILACGLILCQEPDTHRDTGGTKQLSRQRNHAGNQIRFNQFSTNLAFPTRIRRHRTISHDNTSRATWSKLRDDVLNPGVVGIILRWNSVAPALIFFIASPVFNVERWVRKNIVSLHIRMLVTGESITPASSEISVKAMDGKAHLCHTPCTLIELLSVDRDSRRIRIVCIDKFFGLHEHAT